MIIKLWMFYIPAQARVDANSNLVYAAVASEGVG